MKVAYVAAGKTAWDGERRLQGALDVPLCPDGSAAIRALVPELSVLSAKVIYCDPGRTARETADLLGDALHLRVRSRSELRAPELGLWEGLLISDLRRKHPRGFRDWRGNPVDFPPPGGESGEGVLRRAREFVAFLRRKHGDHVVLVVCARMVGQMLRSLLEGCDVRKYLGVRNSRSSDRWTVCDAEGAAVR
ncbi:MAG: histidine phosphatase family protein [Planctomycetota bacterium]